MRATIHGKNEKSTDHHSQIKLQLVPPTTLSSIGKQQLKNLSGRIGGEDQGEQPPWHLNNIGRLKFNHHLTKIPT